MSSTFFKSWVFWRDWKESGLMVIHKIKVHVTKSARYLPDICLLTVEDHVHDECHQHSSNPGFSSAIGKKAD